MTDELTPSLAAVADTDDAKTERQVRAAKVFAEALRPLIDGAVVLAVDMTIIVQHPDGKVGCTNSNIGTNEQTKAWAATAAGRIHSGQLGTPDARESHVLRVPKKH